MIEITTNSNEFRSKDGTVVRIPDADFNIVLRNVTKILLPALPVSERLSSVYGGPLLLKERAESGFNASRTVTLTSKTSTAFGGTSSA
ncbi:hypothetical protein TNCV_49751 [Trichonephila clavipes]|nr:hypothetical protein TNCV_49751 [Trichonephila clavipes]